MLQKPFWMLDALALVRHDDAESVFVGFGHLPNLNFRRTTGVLNHIAGDFGNHRGEAGQNSRRETHFGGLVPADKPRQEHVLHLGGTDHLAGLQPGSDSQMTLSIRKILFANS